MHISILIALRWPADWEAPRRVLQVIEFQEKIISSQAAANVCKYVIPRLVQCVPKGYPQSYPQVTNRLWKAQSGQALGAAWSGKMTRVSANWKPTTGCALHPSHCRHKPEYLMRICTHATAASSARHLCCSATESSLEHIPQVVDFYGFHFLPLDRGNTLEAMQNADLAHSSQDHPQSYPQELWANPGCPASQQIRGFPAPLRQKPANMRAGAGAARQATSALAWQRPG